MVDPMVPIQIVFEEILRNPTLERAKILSEQLTQDVVQQLYCTGRDNLILISILKIIAELNVRNKNEIKTHLIRCVTKIIEISRLRKVVSLKAILAILLKEIQTESSTSNISTPTKLSEELKLSIINCIEIVFRKATTDVIEEFYVNSNRIIIAQILSTCVDIVAKETYRPLRMAGMRCMLSVEQVHEEADASDIVLRDQIANILFILLPKIVLTLTNVATGDETHGQTLIALSITTLGRIYQLIFEDRELNSNCSIVEQTKLLIGKSLSAQPATQYNSNILELSTKGSTAVNKLQEVESKERSAEWMAAASMKLKPVIAKLHKLIGSKSDLIRRELGKFAENLLRYCQRNMSPCVSVLLEIKLGLDEESEQQQSSYIYNDHLIDICEELFVAHLIRLPRVIYTGDEDEQMANVSLLRGLISMLCRTGRLKITLSNKQTLKNLVTITLSMVELDRSIHLLEEDYNIYELTDKNGESVKNLALLRDNTPWKVYKNLRNNQLRAKIEAIGQLLGAMEPVNVFMLEFLHEIITSNATNCNEALIVVQMLMSTAFNAGDACQSIHFVILKEILNDFRWNLATEAIEQNPNSCDDGGKSEWFEDRTEGLYESAVSMRLTDVKSRVHDRSLETITINDVKQNVLHICLVIETLGRYANELNERFQPFLLRSLHRLLEKSAYANCMIRMSALLALNNIKSAFGLNSISELIFYNADYITYSINVSLKRPDQSGKALQILSIVLHYCSIESMPHLENIIATVLEESAKSYQSINVLPFMQVFCMILSTVRAVDFSSKTVQSQREIENKPQNTLDRFEKWFSLLKNANCNDAKMNEQEPSENDESMQESHFDEEMNENPTKPVLINLSIDILKRCIPNLSSKNRDVKLMALEALCIGLDILKDFEDELLPIVHLTWEPFEHQCIHDKSPVVLRCCIQLLAKLAQYAKDFIYKRSHDKLMPYIINYLGELSTKCVAEKTGFLYEHTQEFKLLQELLTSLGDILINLTVQERDLNKVLDATVWLLDKNQPQSLQTNCVNLFRKLASFDSCSVYAKLLKYHKNDRYKLNCKKVYGNQV